MLRVMLVLLLFGYVSKVSDSECNCPCNPPIPVYNPCCSYPCQNGGICIAKGGEDNSYECDCYGLEYYGINCQTPTWNRWLKNIMTLSMETRQTITFKYGWIWGIINRIPFLHRMAMRYIYMSRGIMGQMPPTHNGGEDYTYFEVYYNRSYFSRSLPPVPQNCSTAMGVAGPPELPPVKDVFTRLLKRHDFIPDPHGTNVLFISYAQHFTQQFLKTDYTKGPQFTSAEVGVDASQIYGQTETMRQILRSWTDGKLKTSVINEEEFPPYMEDCPGLVELYSQDSTKSCPNKRSSKKKSAAKDAAKLKFCLVDPLFNTLPTLFVMATVWLREHNRVCDILKVENPIWNDTQLYETARMIIAGEMIQITLSEYFQHLSQYKVNLTYYPEVLHGTMYHYSNRINVEFNHMYHWHSMVPDNFQVENATYTFDELMLPSQNLLNDHGLDTVIDAMTKNIAGKLTYHNHLDMVKTITLKVMQNGRDLRLQSFNNYLRKFGLKPYQSFLQLTGDPEISEELESMYQDIEALEFFPGMILEKHQSAVIPPSMLVMAGSWSIKGLISNPITSPTWWKPSTFGGQVGMDIIRTATLHGLICNNIKSQCEGMYISFTAPTEEKHVEETPCPCPENPIEEEEEEEEEVKESPTMCRPKPPIKKGVCH